MRKVLAAEHFLVIDDFLPRSDLEALWTHVQTQPFELVHAREWVNAWQLGDGVPLRGPAHISHKNGYDRTSPTFPTGTATDLLFGRLLKMEDEVRPYVGSRGVDWSYFYARPYLYPANTGLSWHRDNKGNVTGAYTYYCHPEWNAAWGGELLVAEPETKRFELPKTRLYDGTEAFVGSHLENQAVSDRLMEVGAGSYVLPKPNRLVVLTSGVLHAIKKVDPAAGAHVRATLQGFFLFPDKPDKPPRKPRR